MKHRTSAQGTCVIGEYLDMTAFASIAVGQNVWAKQYGSVADAVREVRHLGLIDTLFATTVPKYIGETKRPCISTLASAVDPKKILAAGFQTAGDKHVGGLQPA